MRGGQHLQNTPAKCLGGGDAGTAGESPRSQRHWPRQMDSGLWLSASKKKGTTRMRTPSPVHRYTFIHTHTHTGHTNEETVPDPPPPPPPSLHLGTGSPMAPYRVTPVYRQEIGPDVLTKAS